MSSIGYRQKDIENLPVDYSTRPSSLEVETKLDPKDRSDCLEQRKGEIVQAEWIKVWGSHPGGLQDSKHTIPEEFKKRKKRQEEISLILTTLLREAIYNPHMPGTRGMTGAGVCITWHSVRNAHLEATPWASGHSRVGPSSAGFASPPRDLGECSSLRHTPHFMINGLKYAYK